MNVRHDHVTVFVIRAAGGRQEFLQLRRAGGDDLGGTWQTVRGTMEAGESAVATALRELREETSLVPRELYSLGLVESFYIAAVDTLWHSPAFLAMVAADAAVVLDAEHDAFRWIDAADADAAFMWPSEVPLLKALRQVIFENGPAKTHLLIPLPQTD